MDQAGLTAVPPSEDPDWAERSEHWLAELGSDAHPRKRRERSQQTLTITGHGASMRIDGGTLLIRNGFTHYPQQREECRYFRGDLDRPDQIVILDGSGSISFDVLDWLAEQEIPLIRLNWEGAVTTAIGGNGLRYEPEKVQWQEQLRGDPKRRIAFCSELVEQKITNAIRTLQSFVPLSANREPCQMLREGLERLRAKPPSRMRGLLGMEGNAGNIYFRTLTGIALNWAGTSRRPIPDDWRAITTRSSMRDVVTARNGRATHPFNAMLNYGYGVLLGQLRIEASKHGYDPRIGVMHDSQKGSPAFLLDLIEPLRPKVDWEILKFVSDNPLHAADFVIRADGAVRLNPQLARRVVDLIVTRVSAAGALPKLAAFGPGNYSIGGPPPALAVP